MFYCILAEVVDPSVIGAIVVTAPRSISGLAEEPQPQAVEGGGLHRWWATLPSRGSSRGERKHWVRYPADSPHKAWLQVIQRDH